MHVKCLFWLQNRKLRQKLTKLSEQASSLGQQPDSNVANGVEATMLAHVSDISQSTETGPLIPPVGGKQTLSIDEMDGEQYQEMTLLEREKLGLHQDIVCLQDKLKQMTAENEALRKGMHEILDSIHNQDGNCLPDVNNFDTYLERSCSSSNRLHCASYKQRVKYSFHHFVIFGFMALCSLVHGHYYCGGFTAPIFPVH
jgi:hypothetical protein